MPLRNLDVLYLSMLSAFYVEMIKLLSKLNQARNTSNEITAITNCVAISTFITRSGLFIAYSFQKNDKHHFH